jgi:hypothetical protein
MRDLPLSKRAERAILAANRLESGECWLKTKLGTAVVVLLWHLKPRPSAAKVTMTPLGLTDTAADALADSRTGKNGRHLLEGLLRQSVFGRLAGYEDVNDADRLCRNPAMRWVRGDRAITGSAASASQMSRFETKWLSRPENLAALADLPGQWIDKVHQRRPPRTIVLDMDSSGGVAL